MTGHHHLLTFAASSLLALIAVSPAASQSQLLASYPLLTDADDATGNHGPMALQGNQTSPPAPANGLCTNGIYSGNAGGHYVGTPLLPALDTDDFELAVEFQITSLPPNPGPVLMGSLSWRWLGIYLDATGAVGIRANNGAAQFSATILTTGVWYSAILKHENGLVELYIDGALAQQWPVGPLSTGNDYTFTTNDGGSAENFDGCIRNLRVANDTTLGTIASAEHFGVGCDGLALDSNGLPTLGNAGFALAVSGVQAAAPVAFLAFGADALPAGLDLSAIGMNGCLVYTSLELGFYGPFSATGGTATIGLPIPNDPALLGSTLTTQAAAPSAATALGLASSNGTRLTFAL